MVYVECKINCKMRLDKDILLKAFDDPDLILPEKDQPEKSLEICSAVLESDSKCF